MWGLSDDPYIIRIRRDTAEKWAEVNPVLWDGEPGAEVDTGGVKIGDGFTRWLDLPYELPPDGPRPWITEGLRIRRTRL